MKNTAWTQFLSLCLKMKSVDELKKLFDLFFTPEEKETLASRFVIVQALLEQKLTQRDLSKIHHVSIAQITRGSNALKIADPHIVDVLERHIKS